MEKIEEITKILTNYRLDLLTTSQAIEEIDILLKSNKIEELSNFAIWLQSEYNACCDIDEEIINEYLNDK